MRKNKKIFDFVDNSVLANHYNYYRSFEGLMELKVFGKRILIEKEDKFITVFERKCGETLGKIYKFKKQDEVIEYLQTLINE